MAFERKSMEYLVNRMVSWARGVSPRLTDFRVGSKTRTIMESVALVVEELYDKLFRGLRQIIEDNVYAIFNFSKVPVTYTTGIATFSRSTPADQNYTIAAGTMLMSKATEYNAPIRFYTSVDVVLAIGTTSVNVAVVCDLPGVQGNIPAGALTTFVQKPIGVEAVTNALEFITGEEEESKEAQKERFQQFLEAQTRGVLQSIEYGAKKAKVLRAETGDILEEVMQALATEDLPDRKGEVDLYICNGIGAASDALIAAVVKILGGYYDDAGNPVYGYKPGGIQVNIYSAPIVAVVVKVDAVAEAYTTVELLKPLIEQEISIYFAKLSLGQTVVQSALEANVKRIKGVYDVKLYLSNDAGETFSTDNVIVNESERALIDGSIVYA